MKSLKPWWCKWYGYDEEYPDEPNYLVLDWMIFGRDILLIIIPNSLAFELHISQNVSKWNPLSGPLPNQYHYTFNPLGH